MEVPHGMYPAAWLGPAGGALRINCGRLPFAYDIEAHARALELTLQRSAVLGSQLPEEIIDHILQLVHDERDTPIYCLPWTVSRMCLEKRSLGLCSLTCHHWLRRCRPLIFSSFRITSLHEAAFLAQLVRSPKYSIAPHVQQLALSEWSGDSNRPWVLQTLAVLGGRLPHLQVLQCFGRDPRSEQAAASQRLLDRRREHPMLSGRLSTLLRGFKELGYLILMQVHFRSFSDVARTVRSLEKLEVFAATGISWDRATPLPPPKECRRGPRKMRVDHCTNAALFLSLLGSAWNIPSDDAQDLPPIPHIAAGDIRALRELVKSMAGETLDIKTTYQDASSTVPQSELSRLSLVLSRD